MIWQRIMTVLEPLPSISSCHIYTLKCMHVDPDSCHSCIHPAWGAIISIQILQEQFLHWLQCLIGANLFVCDVKYLKSTLRVASKYVFCDENQRQMECAFEGTEREGKKQQQWQTTNKNHQNQMTITASLCKYNALLQCLQSKRWGTGEGKRSEARQNFLHYYLL